MGYNSEGASPGKYSKLKKYCDDKVTSALTSVVRNMKKHEDEIKALKPTFEYRPQLEETLTPVAAIDGGIAVLFPNEVSETKIIKIAIGVPPVWKDFLTDAEYEDFTHIFTGQLRWPDGAEKEFEKIVLEMIDIVNENETIQKAREILEVSQEDFNKAIRDRAFHLKSKTTNSLTGFEDNIRELFEISALVCFTHKQKKNKKLIEHFIKNELDVPYVFIKDGTLYPSRMTLSGLLADAVSAYFNSGDVPVVGVIKNSRFVNKDNIWSKVITNYAREVKSHTFFRIPKSVEISIDSNSDDLDFRRYFLSLFGGESIFEIQIPKVLTQDDKKLKFILKVLAEQITFKYGGSISTNSYAHDRASLPEVEARHLTQAVRDDLKTLLKDYKEKKNEP